MVQGTLGLVLTLLLITSVERVASVARPLQDGLAIDSNRHDCAPHEVHLSLTGDASEILVSWRTEGESCPSSVALWTADENAQPNEPPPGANELIGSMSSYSSRDMCSAPARDFDYSPLSLHSVVLTDLVPGARYRYKVKHGSSVFFRAPSAPSPDAGLKFIAFGDMGESEHRAAKSPGAQDTADCLKDEVEAGAELIYHIGDLAYANGHKTIWDTFMDSIEPVASRVPYMVGIGNHEYDWEHKNSHEPDASGADLPYAPDWGNFGNDSGGECGVAAAKHFMMPSFAERGYWAPGANAGNASLGPDGCRNPTLDRVRGAVPSPDAAPAAGAGADAACGAANHGGLAPNPPFWYSFGQGPVHFLTISTEHDLSPHSQQYKWIKRDLARVDRCTTPWVVVGMHRPMYVVFPHKSNRIVGQHLRDHLEELFNRYEVDVVVSGHVHSYSSSCNVLDETCIRREEGGMMHFIVGTAGHKLSHIGRSQYDWVSSTEERFGYLRVDVEPRGGMTLQFVGSEDGRVYDDVRLEPDRARLRACRAAEA
ncbi:hypothetical protein ACKKBG_A03785 [Auxenochlorella protothecoides x Auxenochlorella symbiontica]